MTASNLYEKDFYAWTTEQAALLRAGQLSAADIKHIAEEIDSMGRSEKRELISRLTILLLHLLKWQYQPTRQGASWEASIANTRDDLTDHMAGNPSLKPFLPEAIQSAFRRARREAAAETALSASTFPTTCPWTFEQFMAEDFWPGDEGH